jgi:hypothetical protein
MSVSSSQVALGQEVWSRLRGTDEPAYSTASSHDARRAISGGTS